MLIFLGSPGVGKTMFCAAVLDWCYDKFPWGRSIRYWNERDLFQKIRESISSDAKGDYLKVVEYCIDDYLVILDDLGSSGLNDWRREVWLDIIDSRYNTNLPTIITSNFNLAEIKSQLGERSHSRLMSKDNTIIQMHGYKDMRREK